MTKKAINQDRLNVEIRTFLKRVGITSQREIENAVRTAVESGKLPDTVSATMTLEVPALKLKHVVTQDIAVG